MPVLDETVTPGQLGHISDHEALHTRYNLDFSARDYGAVGNGVTTGVDADGINAAMVAASAASAAGQRSTVIIPIGVYLCDDELTFQPDIKVINYGHLKFTGGDAIGGFAVIRAVNNVEVTGGLWDSNFQGNDNTIAVTFVNPDQSVAGPASENIWVHDLRVANARHGGSHIVDPDDPADVGRGGGKGVTVQFGVKKCIVSNVIVDDCDLGVSVEGKEADSGYVQDILFDNVVVKGSKYMGLYLTSVPTTVSLYGQTTSVSFNNVQLVDCGVGQTTEAVPQDIADLFGAITCQGMVAAKGDITVRSTTGKTTVMRGAMRHCDLKVNAIVGGELVDLVNTAPYDGYNPTLIASRYNRLNLNLIILGTTFSGFLVNNDATYPANFSEFDIVAIFDNNGTYQAVPTAQYAANFPADSMMIFKDLFNGRFFIANDAAALDGAVSNIFTYIQGVGFEDDSGGNLSKIVATRSNLALADSAGNSQLLVGTGFATANNKFLLARSTLTIAAGAVTATKTRHYIDTEAAAAADDLDTITTTSDGELLVLSSVNAARVVTVKNNTGNIRLAGGADFVLDSPFDQLTLIYDSTQSRWCELARSSNA